MQARDSLTGSQQTERDDCRPPAFATPAPFGPPASDSTRYVLDAHSKTEAPKTRPCGVIAPERAHRATSPRANLHLPQRESWFAPDHGYNYALAANAPTDYVYPQRNISPRQTFQENMKRIQVPARCDPSKINPEATMPMLGYPHQVKSSKINSNTDTKYCQVPYITNQIPSQQRTSVFQNNEAYATPDPSSLQAPSWTLPAPPMPGQVPYYSSDYCNLQVNMIPPSARAVRLPHKKITETSYPQYEAVYPGGVQLESKEKKSHIRYNNYHHYHNTYHTSKIDASKQAQQTAPVYINYTPHKVVDPRIIGDPRFTDPNIPPYVRSGQYLPTYKAPHLIDHVPNKYAQHSPSYPMSRLYGYPDNGPHPASIVKNPYDVGKTSYEYDFRQGKPAQASENSYGSEVHPHSMRGPFPLNHYPQSNIQARMANYNSYHNQGDAAVKSCHDSALQCKYQVFHSNTHNPLAQIPTQFSPKIISPTESNASVDSFTMQRTLQEDCGYVSQCSTTSTKSMDSYYRYKHNENNANNKLICAKPLHDQHLNKSKDSKILDVRQFLQNWDEGDDDDCLKSKEVHQINSDPKTNSVNSNRISEANPTEQPLYVLGCVNIPSEDVDKYEHLETLYKLPENIRGYDGSDLLEKFDKAFQPPIETNVIEPTAKSRPVEKQTSVDVARAPSPFVDIEAKITQSVIHKDVKCNFEIKPFSPPTQMMSSSPIPQNSKERKIEKIFNHTVEPAPVKSQKDIIVKTTTKRQFRQNFDTKDEIEMKHKIAKTHVDCKYKMVESRDNAVCKGYDTESEVCFSSLPRLDSEMEMNFPEINEQYNVIRQHDSVIMNMTQVVNDESKNLALNQANDQQQPSRMDSCVYSYLCASEKSFNDKGEHNIDTKLCISKSVSSSDDPESLTDAIQNNNQLDGMVQRTDSVIIKNPDTAEMLLPSYQSTFKCEDEAAERKTYNNTIGELNKFVSRNDFDLFGYSDSKSPMNLIMHGQGDELAHFIRPSLIHSVDNKSASSQKTVLSNVAINLSIHDKEQTISNLQVNDQQIDDITQPEMTSKLKQDKSIEADVHEGIPGNDTLTISGDSLQILVEDTDLSKESSIDKIEQNIENISLHIISTERDKINNEAEIKSTACAENKSTHDHDSDLEISEAEIKCSACVESYSTHDHNSELGITESFCLVKTNSETTNKVNCEEQHHAGLPKKHIDSDSKLSFDQSNQEPSYLILDHDKVHTDSEDKSSNLKNNSSQQGCNSPQISHNITSKSELNCDKSRDIGNEDLNEGKQGCEDNICGNVALSHCTEKKESVPLKKNTLDEPMSTISDINKIKPKEFENYECCQQVVDQNVGFVNAERDSKPQSDMLSCELQKPLNDVDGVPKNVCVSILSTITTGLTEQNSDVNKYLFDTTNNNKVASILLQDGFIHNSCQDLNPSKFKLKSSETSNLIDFELRSESFQQTQEITKSLKICPKRDHKFNENVSSIETSNQSVFSCKPNVQSFVEENNDSSSCKSIGEILGLGKLNYIQGEGTGSQIIEIGTVPESAKKSRDNLMNENTLNLPDNTQSGNTDEVVSVDKTEDYCEGSTNNETFSGSRVLSCSQSVANPLRKISKIHRIKPKNTNKNPFKKSPGSTHINLPTQFNVAENLSMPESTSEVNEPNQMNILENPTEITPFESGLTNDPDQQKLSEGGICSVQLSHSTESFCQNLNSCKDAGSNDTKDENDFCSKNHKNDFHDNILDATKTCPTLGSKSKADDNIYIEDNNNPEYCDVHSTSIQDSFNEPQNDCLDAATSKYERKTKKIESVKTNETVEFGKDIKNNNSDCAEIITDKLLIERTSEESVKINNCIDLEKDCVSDNKSIIGVTSLDNIEVEAVELSAQKVEKSHTKMVSIPIKAMKTASSESTVKNISSAEVDYCGNGSIYKYEGYKQLKMSEKQNYGDVGGDEVRTQNVSLGEIINEAPSTQHEDLYHNLSTESLKNNQSTEVDSTRNNYTKEQEKFTISNTVSYADCADKKTLSDHFIEDNVNNVGDLIENQTSDITSYIREPDTDSRKFSDVFVSDVLCEIRPEETGKIKFGEIDISVGNKENNTTTRIVTYSVNVEDHDTISYNNCLEDLIHEIKTESTSETFSSEKSMCIDNEFNRNLQPKVSKDTLNTKKGERIGERSTKLSEENNNKLSNEAKLLPYGDIVVEMSKVHEESEKDYCNNTKTKLEPETREDIISLEKTITNDTLKGNNFFETGTNEISNETVKEMTTVCEIFGKNRNGKYENLNQTYVNDVLLTDDEITNNIMSNDNCLKNPLSDNDDNQIKDCCSENFSEENLSDSNKLLRTRNKDTEEIASHHKINYHLPMTHPDHQSNNKDNIVAKNIHYEKAVSKKTSLQLKDESSNFKEDIVFGSVNSMKTNNILKKQIITSKTINQENQWDKTLQGIKRETECQKKDVLTTNQAVSIEMPDPEKVSSDAGNDDLTSHLAFVFTNLTKRRHSDYTSWKRCVERKQHSLEYSNESIDGSTPKRFKSPIPNFRTSETLSINKVGQLFLDDKESELKEKIYFLRNDVERNIDSDIYASRWRNRDSEFHQNKKNTGNENVHDIGEDLHVDKSCTPIVVRSAEMFADGNDPYMQNLAEDPNLQVSTNIVSTMSEQILDELWTDINVKSKTEYVIELGDCTNSEEKMLVPEIKCNNDGNIKDPATNQMANINYPLDFKVCEFDNGSQNMCADNMIFNNVEKIMCMEPDSTQECHNDGSKKIFENIKEKKQLCIKDNGNEEKFDDEHEDFTNANDSNLAEECDSSQNSHSDNSSADNIDNMYSFETDPVNQQDNFIFVPNECINIIDSVTDNAQENTKVYSENTEGQNTLQIVLEPTLPSTPKEVYNLRNVTVECCENVCNSGAGEMWIDDIACIETVVSEDAENTDDNYVDDLSLTKHLIQNDKGTTNYAFDFAAKIKNIYGDNMNYNDVNLVKTLYTTPHMDVSSKLNAVQNNTKKICSSVKSKKKISKNKFSVYGDIETSKEKSKVISAGKSFESNKNCKSDLTKKVGLITKAAQKYLPPLNICNDLQVRLALPGPMLTKLRNLKITSTKMMSPIPKLKISPSSFRKVDRNCNKRVKPIFEDVLKTIDDTQYGRNVKCKNKNKLVPKVIIKKNQTGNRYTSKLEKGSSDPDLTGSRWQPCVSLVRWPAIEKMVSRKRTRSKICNIFGGCNPR